MAFRSDIKPHDNMVPVRSLLVILEKLLTTYTGGFNHLCDRKSRKISAKPCRNIFFDLVQGWWMMIS